MKKLLGSTLALAMLVPAGANAQLFKNLKVSGVLDVQADSANNITDFKTRPSVTPPATNNDRIGAAYTRLILSADWDLLDDVHSRVTLVKGANNEGFISATRAYGQKSENLNNVQQNTFVEEANVKIDKLFGAVDTRIGRQFYGEAGDLVAYFGPKDNYGLNVSAIDAFRFDWAGENIGVTGLAGVTNNPGAPSGLATDLASTDLRALLVNYKTEAATLGAYVYNQVTHATGGGGTDSIGNTNGGKNDFLYVVGVKGNVSLAGLKAKAELAKDLGQNRTLGPTATPAAEQASNYSGWALKANLDYTLELSNVGKVNPWAEFGYGSGRSRSDSNHNEGFVAINTDYRPGGIYGRFDNTAANALASLPFPAAPNPGASNGLSNRVIYGIGIKGTPAMASKLTVGVQGYKYAFARTSDTVVFTGTKQLSRNIGTEVDVTAEWKHSENVALKATVGTFKPGAYFADLQGANAELNPATLAALDVNIKF